MFYSTTVWNVCFFFSTSKILYTGEESKPNLYFLHAGTYRFCIIHSYGIVKTKKEHSENYDRKEQKKQHAWEREICIGKRIQRTYLE